MKIFESLFSNQITFILFLIFVNVSVFYSIHEIVTTVRDNYKYKQKITEIIKQEAKQIKSIQKEIDIRGELIKRTKQTLKELDQRIIEKSNLLKELEKKFNQKVMYRWHSYDMRIWCDEAEQLNALNNFICPDIGAIMGLTRKKYEKGNGEL